MESKTIKLEFEGKEYLLAYTRRSAKQMEQTGFDVSKIESMPLTMYPLLFQGAFICNHTGLKRAKIDEIFEALGNDRGAIINALADMYIEVLNSLSGTGNADETKKVQWEIM